MRCSFFALLSGLAMLTAGSLAAPLAPREESSTMAARGTQFTDMSARTYFDDSVSHYARFFDEDDLVFEAREPVVDPTHFRIGIIIRPHEPIPPLEA